MLAFGQVFEVEGDDWNPLDSIYFESPSPYVTIPEYDGNLWQIATPQKTFFESSYSPDNAILTDSIEFYPVNNYSHFDLNFSQTDFDVLGYNFFITFRHKIDTDTLRDGGYITASIDGGESWINILDFNACGFAGYPADFVEFGTLYGSSDTLFNGERGFSGHSDWRNCHFGWYFLPVNSMHFPQFCFEDITLRFNFISDTLAESQEGWMIDNIRIRSHNFGSSTGEEFEPTIVLFPNPTFDILSITLDEVKLMEGYDILDQQGKQVQSGELKRQFNAEIFVGDLPSGVYTLRLKLSNQRDFFRKFIKE
ncbi:MAG: T9SS type A sorting domain-containing protein [Cryomorphaceae bacterium]|nr:T9SS type A sorting domain-containing protein [Cryomorphaceae bacterium]